VGFGQTLRLALTAPKICAIDGTLFGQHSFAEQSNLMFDAVRRNAWPLAKCAGRLRGDVARTRPANSSGRHQLFLFSSSCCACHSMLPFACIIGGGLGGLGLGAGTRSVLPSPRQKFALRRSGFLKAFIGLNSRI
jgi:hypothetical protein